jgi:hypothetical protein
MLVMLVQLLLWLLLGTGCLLLAMEDQPIGRTADKRILVSVGATKLVRR